MAMMYIIHPMLDTIYTIKMDHKSKHLWRKHRNCFMIKQCMCEYTSLAKSPVRLSRVLFGGFKDLGSESGGLFSSVSMAENTCFVCHEHGLDDNIRMLEK